MNEKQQKEQKIERKVKGVLKNLFSGTIDALLDRSITDDEGKGSIYNYNGEILICRGFINEGSYGRVYMYSTEDEQNRYALKHITICKNIGKREELKQKTACEIQIQTEIMQNRLYALPLYQSSKTFEEISKFDFETQGDLNVDVLLPLGRSCFDLFYDLRNEFYEIQQLCIAYELYRSLESLQNNGIMHRDIKPGNIIALITNDEKRDVQLLLSDFSVSYKLSAKRSYLVTNGIGTHPYLDPNLTFDENGKLLKDNIRVYRKKEELFASDVYCMAKVLLALLLNREDLIPEEYDKYMTEYVEKDNEGNEIVRKKLPETAYVVDFTESIKKIKSDALRDILSSALILEWDKRPTVENIVGKLKTELLLWCD